MNEPNVPQMNAAKTLYPTSERYTGVASRADGAGGQTVIPQAIGCVCRCIRIPFLGRRCFKCCAFPPGCRVTSSC